MNRCSTLLKSQAGQSELLGLIIASAIGAIVIAATTTSFVELNKGQNNITKTSDALDVKKDIEQLLTDPEACRRNFQNLNGSGQSRTNNLVDDTGAVRYEINENLTGFNVRIASWNLRDDITLNPTSPVQQIMVLNLILDKGTQVVGAQSVSRTIKLWTQRTGAANSAIEDCHALTGSSSDIWLRHANQNDVYNGNFNSRVMIGAQAVPVVAPTPQLNTKLFVLGANQADANMVASGGVSARTFDVQGNFTQSGSSTNSVAGFVGIGTIAPAERFDVNGSMSAIGNLTIAGTLNAVDLLSPISAVVGTNFTVGDPTGNSLLGSMAVRGNAVYASTSQFEGDLQVNGQTVMEETLSVRDGPVATNTLGVIGAMVTTGLVTVPRVNAANEFCIGANCRTTFATQPCLPGQVAYQNEINGEVRCSNISCPQGTFFRGMTGPNQPICAALPTATCPTNTYISGYRADSASGSGTYTCTPIRPEVHVPSCPSGYLYAVVAGIAQCAPLALAGGDCGPGMAVSSIDSQGRPTCVPVFQNAGTCPAGQIQTGMQPNGAVVCSNIAVASSCTTDGQVLSSISATRSAVCGSVSIAGGSCPSGIRAISSTGAVTCF